MSRFITNYYVLRMEKSTEHRRSIKELPESVTDLLQCPAPASNPAYPANPRFGLFAEMYLPVVVRHEEFAWLLARSMTREVSRGETDEPTQTHEPTKEQVERSGIPVWSGYKSLISDNLHVTRVSTPPLIAAPAHEWNTLLTVLMQAQAINTKVVGPNRKTVISLDMGLYQPAKKLQMHRSDLDHIILRPGELHIVMALLRTIGSFIDNSGIDLCWTESELYGPSTVRQIIEGKHVRRGENTHLITLQALFTMYQESLFQDDLQSHQRLEQVAKELSEACFVGKEENVKKANAEMISTIENLRIVEKMRAFDEAHARSPLFMVMRQYMRMIMQLLAFIKSVRTGDWILHLESLELFTKYFFAHDLLNYARMIPIYIAEMGSLKESSPEVYEEFVNGNWVVNKNSEAPFCAVGADTALEHVNRSMKVTGGLIGITQNPSARAKFFLIAPELARLAGEAKEMAGMNSKTQTKHHNLAAFVLQREDRAIDQLLTTLQNFGNPFEEESNDLYNMVAKVVMPEAVKSDLCRQSEIGRTLYETFVKERIQSNKVNLWSTMKKRKLLTWKDSAKVLKVPCKDRVVELQEDRSLFARLMFVCKSRPEVDVKEAIGRYEFSVVPRSLSAADGTMLHCPAKSTLMRILETLGGDPQQTHEVASGNNVDEMMNFDMEPLPQMKVAVVDAMAELQCIDKPEDIKNISQLAEHFNKRITKKFQSSDEVRLIFDRYDLPSSLKTATRVRRQAGKDPVFYRITDSTHIAKVPMRRLLSHTETKKELTSYLGKKFFDHAKKTEMRVVVAYGNECQGTHEDVAHLQSTQEEADTKIVLHALDAASNGATQLLIYSPDTDVLVLCLRRCPELCVKTSFVTGTGQNWREIDLGAISSALGSSKLAALPAFHALSGADVTGSFSGKGKPACWKVFKDENAYKGYDSVQSEEDDSDSDA